MSKKNKTLGYITRHAAFAVTACLLITFPALAAKGKTLWETGAKLSGIPAPLLFAIATTESGRRDNTGEVKPHPWTLNSPATGPLYFDTKAGATEALRLLLARRVDNIDIGLMQINIQHAQRVKAPEALLEPATNILVASQILKENLSSSRGDLRLALARYHSWREERGEQYVTRVLEKFASSYTKKSFKPGGATSAVVEAKTISGVAR